jgi:hypothetical protein
MSRVDSSCSQDPDHVVVSLGQQGSAAPTSAASGCSEQKTAKPLSQGRRVTDED